MAIELSIVASSPYAVRVVGSAKGAIVSTENRRYFVHNIMGNCERNGPISSHTEDVE
jgi:hypothetical protein